MRLLALMIALTMISCGDDQPAGGPDAAGAAGDAAVPVPDADPSAPDAAPSAADASPDPAGDPGAAGDLDPHIADDVSIPVGQATVTATICSPSSDGGSTPIATASPLVVMSPGFQLPRSQYLSACEHLATWGYLVILQTYSQSGFSIDHQTLADDVGRIIDWALGGDSGLAARVDGDRIAATGHSLGGKVSILAATGDARIGAVIGWDPVDANSPSVTPELMDELTIPLAVIGETLDSSGGFMPCAPADNNYQQYFEHACAATAALEVTVAEADHMDWVDDRSSCGITCSFCSTGETDDAVTRQITRRLTTAWLEVHLRGRSDAAGYLATPALGSGVTVRDTVPGC
jgi:dienelactone hydrolase